MFFDYSICLGHSFGMVLFAMALLSSYNKCGLHLSGKILISETSKIYIRFKTTKTSKPSKKFVTSKISKTLKTSKTSKNFKTFKSSKTFKTS